MDDSEARSEQLQTLSDERCLELLGQAETARVAWCTARGPVVIPVNIRLDGTRVLIRTSAGSALAERVDVERVAVQVDDVDAASRRGWSVLARGVAHVHLRPAREEDPEPWPAGPHSALVEVAIDELSGRWLPAPGDGAG